MTLMVVMVVVMVDQVMVTKMKLIVIICYKYVKVYIF
jgi:hypothetical protein